MYSHYYNRCWLLTAEETRRNSSIHTRHVHKNNSNIANVSKGCPKKTYRFRCKLLKYIAKIICVYNAQITAECTKDREPNPLRFSMIIYAMECHIFSMPQIQNYLCYLIGILKNLY